METSRPVPDGQLPVCDGWIGLPYGGWVLVTGKGAIRVSNGVTDDNPDGTEPGEVRRGLDEMGYERWEIGRWSVAYGEPDCTAPIYPPED